MIYKDEIVKYVSVLKSADKYIAQLEAFDNLSALIKNILKQEEDTHAKFDIPERELHQKIHNEFVRDLFSISDQYFVGKKINKTKIDHIIELIEVWIDVHEQKFDNFTDSFIRISEFAA